MAPSYSANNDVWSGLGGVVLEAVFGTQRALVARVPCFPEKLTGNMTLFSGRGLFQRVSKACGTLLFGEQRRLERFWRRRVGSGFCHPKGPCCTCAMFSGEVDREHDSFLRTRIVLEVFKSVWHPPIRRTTTSRAVLAASCWKWFLAPNGPLLHGVPCFPEKLTVNMTLFSGRGLFQRVVKSVWHPPIR